MTDRAERRWSQRQMEAIETRGTNVLVSAGAGSGKTSVLVERVVQCLLAEPGMDLTNLLVVTFTEAAAAEMRERIAARIQALRVDASERGETQLARHLGRQAALLDQAQISTLHSFCMEIVRRNVFVLGLDPTFSLIDPNAATVLRSTLLQERLEKCLAADEDGRFRRMLGRFGATDPTRLFDLVLRFDTFAQSQPDPQAWLHTVAAHFTETADSLQETVWMAPFRALFKRKYNRTLALCERGLVLTEGADELQRYHDAFVTAVDRLRPLRTAAAENPFAAAQATLQAQAALAARVSAKAHPNRELAKVCRSEAQDLLAELASMLERGEAGFLTDIHQLAPDVVCLIELVEAFASDYEAAKRKRGEVDFSDLEHLALTALQHPESGEAARLQERFQEIFVDEYQDISPIQDALVRAVARREGNTFVVGDVKQSIYRFRMAEPELFLHQYQSLGHSEPGRVIDLSTNYRSRPEIVEMVNFVFAQLFQAEFGGIVYDDGAAMQTGATYPPLKGPFTEFHVIYSGQQDQEEEGDGAAEDSAESTAAGSVLETEAMLIANRILTLIGQAGQPAEQVFDAKTGTLRPATYRDIVILLRSAKGRVETLLDVFGRAGIPAYAATSSGFYDTVEIRWLLAALRAIANPRRDIDLAALLRSPLIGLDDETLGWIRTASKGPFWQALQQAATDDAEVPAVVRDRARKAMQTLQSWRLRARTESAAAMIRTVLADTQLITYVLSMTDGATRKANIERLTADARAYDETQFDGVFGFVGQVQRFRDEAVDQGEASTLAESEDVVRVMTIHQSKGLEFPIVFVANLGKPFYQGTAEQSFPLHAKFGFGPQFYDEAHHRRWHTFPWIALTEANKAAFLAEEARVLYVAMTRARERLILVGSDKRVERLLTRASNWFKQVDNTLDADGIFTAKSMLDWLTAAFLRHPDAGLLRSLLSEDAQTIHLLPVSHGTLHVGLWNHEAGSAIHWQTADRQDSAQPASVSDLARLLDHHAAGAVAPEFTWTAPASATRNQMPGKVSATELRRLWSARQGQGAESFGSAEKLLDDPLFVETSAALRREAGTAFHTVMQHIPFSTECSAAAVEAVVRDLHERGVLSDRAAELVHADDVLRFLNHSLGRALANAQVVFREQPFFKRIPVDDAFVAVQGVIDCLAKLDSGWVLIDYKTDHVRVHEAPAHAEAYRAQIATYLSVARQLVGDVPISAYLYFVEPGVAVPVTGIDLTALFSS